MNAKVHQPKPVEDTPKKQPSDKGVDMTNVKQYRKKPVVIEAILWDGTNWSEICDWTKNWGVRGEPFPTDEHMDILIETLEGEMKCNLGDYIIKGVQGEFYPCKPDIFEATYEAV